MWPSVGLGQALGFVLPDAMLADIIDYAELHSGSRDEGIHPEKRKTQSWIPSRFLVDSTLRSGRRSLGLLVDLKRTHLQPYSAVFLCVHCLRSPRTVTVL